MHFEAAQLGKYRTKHLFSQKTSRLNDFICTSFRLFSLGSFSVGSVSNLKLEASVCRHRSP